MATATQTPPKQGATKAQVPQTKPPAGVAELITANIAVINRIIPKHLNADRMIHLALQLSRRPELATCTPASFVNVFMESAKLGLELDSRGLAYAVPFNNTKVTPARREAQFLIGYKGLIKLATNSGKVRNIFAHEVYEGDTFDYGYGLDPYLVHKPCGKREKCTHVYAVANFKDGGHHFEVMTIEEVKEIRDKFSKAKDKGPWVENPREMFLKTVCRRLCKFLPASPELAQAVALDEAAEAGLPQDFSILPDLGTVDAAYSVDPDEPAMEEIKTAVRNGNGQAPKKAETKADPPPQAEPTPAEPAAEQEQPAADPHTEAEAAPAEEPSAEETLYLEYRSRIHRAANKEEAVAAFNAASEKGELSMEWMVKLQGVIKDRLKQLNGKK